MRKVVSFLNDGQKDALIEALDVAIVGCTMCIVYELAMGVFAGL